MALDLARFTGKSLNCIQHPNAPVLQHSGTMLPAEPVNYYLAPRTNFSILKYIRSGSNES